jgi:hypothetical protein
LLLFIWVIPFLISSLYILIISICFNFLISYFLCLAPYIFLYFDIFCQCFIWTKWWSESQSAHYNFLHP